MDGQETGIGQSRLEQLRTQLAQWRRAHGGRGRRIPEGLWAEATEVARAEGVETTARHLRLSRRRLEERVAAGRECRPEERSPIERPEFIEVALPERLSAGRVMLKLTNRHGEELCIVDMAGSVDIRTLLRDFWGKG